VSETTTPPADGAESPTRPVVPRTVNLAIAAVCMQVFFVVLRAGAFFGFSDELKRLLVKANNDLKSTDKNKKNPYTPTQIAHDLHTWRQNTLLNGIVIAVALLFLAWTLRKVTMATVTRWALFVVMFLTGGPLDLLQLSTNLPAALKALYALSALSAIAAIVLLFMPDSRIYFRAIGDVRRAQYGNKYGSRPAAAPRPSLRTMFAPRPTATSNEPEATSTPTAKPTAAAAGGRAKSRADADAIERGARLARERAKAASKSRRTEAR
ncbi:MAG TPA: hypothetical protein VKQ07_04545, partial [Jatrophihabitantaceae bacterium]|nr:hypothetical protein [Jatrophihabitantaceae bacterium]